MAVPRIIANMGLFWRREKVSWRGDRKAGAAKLLGIKETAKRAGQEDFWEQAGIYALYDDYKLVYIGQVGMGDKKCLGDRLKDHTKDHLAGRWNTFSWFGVRKTKKNGLGKKPVAAHIPMSVVANILEGVLIEVAEPPLNKQKGRFGSAVVRYKQQEAPASKTFEEVVDSLRKEIKAIAKAMKKK